MIQEKTITFARKGDLAHALLEVAQFGTLRVAVRPVRRLDGQSTLARTWEVTVRRPVSKVLACGTSPNKTEAEAAIAAAIERILLVSERRRLWLAASGLQAMSSTEVEYERSEAGVNVLLGGEATMQESTTDRLLKLRELMGRSQSFGIASSRRRRSAGRAVREAEGLNKVPSIQKVIGRKTAEIS